MTAAVGEAMTMDGRWKPFLLWTGFAVVAAAAIGCGAYAYLHKDVFAPAAVVSPAGPAAAQDAPTTIGRMKLAGQFAGPLKDTIVQRWQDPQTGTVCYIYLPVVVQHSPPTPTGYVQYGANGIGSISCLK